MGIIKLWLIIFTDQQIIIYKTAIKLQNLYMRQTDTKNDKHYKIGIYVTIVTMFVLLFLAIFWQGKEPHGLSCLVMDHKLHKAIETAQKYRENGAATHHKKELTAEFEFLLEQNRKINCGFPEKVIVNQMNF